jgi:hypothetical protein
LIPDSICSLVDSSLLLFATHTGQLQEIAFQEMFMQQEFKCAINAVSVKKIVPYQGLRKDTMVVTWQQKPNQSI